MKRDKVCIYFRSFHNMSLIKVSSSTDGTFSFFCTFSFRSVQQREKTENSLDKKKFLTKGHLNS